MKIIGHVVEGDGELLVFKSLGDGLIFFGNIGVQNVYLVFAAWRSVCDHRGEGNDGIFKKVVIASIKDGNAFAHKGSPWS
jgi:hypothetical protein